ncbi:MAG: hypothetical protein Q7R83_00770 [bacterium]|nr:hypothetical protein [bacterium]
MENRDPDLPPITWKSLLEIYQKQENFYEVRAMIHAAPYAIFDDDPSLNRRSQRHLSALCRFYLRAGDETSQECPMMLRREARQFLCSSVLRPVASGSGDEEWDRKHLRLDEETVLLVLRFFQGLLARDHLRGLSQDHLAQLHRFLERVASVELTPAAGYEFLLALVGSQHFDYLEAHFAGRENAVHALAQPLRRWLEHRGVRDVQFMRPSYVFRETIKNRHGRYYGPRDEHNAWVERAAHTGLYLCATLDSKL